MQYSEQGYSPLQPKASVQSTLPEPLPAVQELETVQESENDQETAKTVRVSIEGFAYRDSRIRINKGDTVVWTNKDSASHTVTSGSFDSGRLTTGKTFSKTFTKPETYYYSCSIHPSMKGKIVVQ